MTAIPWCYRLPENAAIDVDLLSHEWVDAVEVVGLGSKLLDGLIVRRAPAFESWLLSERRRVAAASEAILHEAALGLMARGALDQARGFAVRAAAMSPLDENDQALVIRIYRLMGDDVAAGRQYAAWTELLQTELGVAPPDARVSRFVNGLRRESWSTTMLESTTPVAVSGAATGVAARAATPVGVVTRR